MFLKTSKMQRGATGNHKGQQRGDHSNFFKKFKECPTYSKLSANCQEPFLSSKQLLSKN
jgi:hypothetical protein